MTKQDIIDYVVKTPHNTNKAVLGSMLDQMSGGSSGGSDISIITIPVTHTLPEGAVFDRAYGVIEVSFAGYDFMSEGNIYITESLDAILVDGYCKVYNIQCQVDGGLCIPDTVTTTGDIEWNNNNGQALDITGEGTVAITWMYAD